jgi:hypothetical protein
MSRGLRTGDIHRQASGRCWRWRSRGALDRRSWLSRGGPAPPPLLAEHRRDSWSPTGNPPQLDDFNWRRARTAVDLVDLYLASFVAISVRILRRAGLRPWLSGNDFAGLPPLALVSITVGLQLADRNGPPDRRRAHGPFRPGPSDRSADDRRLRASKPSISNQHGAAPTHSQRCSGSARGGCNH